MKTLNAWALGMLCLACTQTAHAAALTSAAGLSNTVTFSGALSRGTVITSQFAADGVVLGGTGAFFIGSTAYSSNPGFSGKYLDNYSGIPPSGVPGSSVYYSINFLSDVQAAGAYFEFNAGAPAATISAYNDGLLIESFAYSNVNCCTTSEFLGFTGLSFDELRVSNVANNGALLMDSVSFSAAVPEPQTLVLAVAGIAVLGCMVRRKVC